MLLRNERVDPPLERKQLVAYDMRLRWPWLIFFISSFPAGISCSALVVKGVLLRFGHANLVLCLGVTVSIICCFTSAFGWLALGVWEECVFAILFAIGLVPRLSLFRAPLYQRRFPGI